MEQLLTSGEFAKLAGTTKRTIAWYNHLGIIKPLEVTSKGYRYYAQSQILEYQMVLQLVSLGISLTEIKKFLENKGTLKTLFESKKQIVISGDGPPNKLKELSPEGPARLGAGGVPLFVLLRSSFSLTLSSSTTEGESMRFDKLSTPIGELNERSALLMSLACKFFTGKCVISCYNAYEVFVDNDDKHPKNICVLRISALLAIDAFSDNEWRRAFLDDPEQIEELYAFLERVASKT
jgi:DNA-binding transcriptional MerR regulator